LSSHLIVALHTLYSFQSAIPIAINFALPRQSSRSPVLMYHHTLRSSTLDFLVLLVSINRFGFQGLSSVDLVVYPVSVISSTGIFNLKQYILISLKIPGGGKESRTPDLLLARQALSQLSYTPTS
jgi:hypothetical protein